MTNQSNSAAQRKSAIKKILNSEFFDYVMIAIGMMAYGMGWTLFLLPNDITTGGVAGVSSLLYWGMEVPVQVSYFGVNALLLLGALKVLGFRFCLKTIYAVGVLTLLLSFLTNLGKEMHLLQDQPFMASIIGAIFCGSGVGLGLSFNGSTGGTDIVAAIVNKYRDISLGRVILLCDIFIITCSYLVFHDFLLHRSGGELPPQFGAVLHHLKPLRRNRPPHQPGTSSWSHRARCAGLLFRP